MNLFLLTQTEQSKNFVCCSAALAPADGLVYGKFMLSVVIETSRQEEALARTLASLVGGAVEGLVREVIVCDAGQCAQTRNVAEHAGCHYLPGGDIEAGIARARGDWLLLLEPGARLMDGWMDAVMAHVETAGGAARFTVARQSGISLLGRIFSRRRPLVGGLVITRREALALAGPKRTAGSIAGSVSARRLGAEIVAAPVA